MRSRPSRAVVIGALLSLLATGAALAADDPYRTQQWGLDRVRAPEVWTSATGREIVVAIVDTGVDLTHPDLQERFLRDAEGRVVGWDAVDRDDDPQDENGHGTMVAGIVAAMTGNGIGIAGAAPGARLMPVRVLGATGGGRSADLDAGIRWAVDNGADVINLSLESVVAGPAGDAGLPGAAPVAAVDYAWRNGVVVVAAAGNSESPYTDYPPTSPALLVGATDRDDRKAGFSDAGRIDAVMAPGVQIVSTWCKPTEQSPCDEELRYGIADGTSFAAPFVSGAIAILREIGFDHREAVERVRETARDLGEPGPDLDTGVGLLDISAAVEAPPPAPASPAPSEPEASASPSEVVPAGDGTSPAAAPSPAVSPTADGAGSGGAPSPAPSAAEPREPSPPSPIAAPVQSTGGRTGLILVAVLLLIGTAVAAGVALRDER